MKHLYLIGGTMGVGKTTVSMLMKEKLTNSVFLDGDWCWDMNPFQVTEETKEMVLDNICHLLNNFIACSAFEHIVFCWVMQEQKILDRLLSGLNIRNCVVHLISLICEEAPLRARLEKDVAAGLRTPDVIGRSVSRLPLYQKLDTVKIDVSGCSAEEAADCIITLAAGRET